MKQPIVYRPEIQVSLHKTITRRTVNGVVGTSERFQESVQNSVIDLTPFLGDAGSVNTNKSLAAPAGDWTVTLADKALQRRGSLESLYGLIEPMDMVEIRMRHGAAQSAGQMTVVMRGFVTQVRRAESMGADGRPQRAVVIAGHDYGKIWEIIQINFAAGLLLGKGLVTNFQLFEQYGEFFETTLSTRKFFNTVVDKVINPYLAELMPTNSVLPRQIVADAQLDGGSVSTGIQTQQGSIFNLVRTFCDVGAWNELYIEDRDDGVYCVLRPNPYFHLTTGELIQPNDRLPVFVEVDSVDLVSISVSRSDADVANFYWVDGARFQMVDGQMQRLNTLSAANDPSVVLTSYGNSKSSLYGIRLMRVETMQGDPEMSTHNTGAKAKEAAEIERQVALWTDRRRADLVAQNRDNVLLERGTIRLRGNEALKVGRYLWLRRGSTEATYYITAVSHEYLPLGGFTTTLQVDRGTGFADRITKGGSPYLSELEDAS